MKESAGRRAGPDTRPGLTCRETTITLGDIPFSTMMMRRGYLDSGQRRRAPDVPLSDIDLGSWDFWARDDDVRDGAFATLRREAPVSWHPRAFVGEELRTRAGATGR